MFLYPQYVKATRLYILGELDGLQVVFLARYPYSSLKIRQIHRDIASTHSASQLISTKVEEWTAHQNIPAMDHPFGAKLKT